VPRGDYYNKPLIHNLDKEQWISKFAQSLFEKNENDITEPYALIDNHIYKVKPVKVLQFYTPTSYEIINAINPLFKWQSSSEGIWVTENAVSNPTWSRYINIDSSKFQYIVVARFTEKKLSEYYLRWGKC